VSATAPDQVEGDARKKLDRADYERFQPIVRRIAMRAARSAPRHVAVADLVSCGWVGLMEALHRAHAGMPAEEFEAYASYRIRGAMLDYVRSLDSSVRRVRRASRRLTRAIKELTQAHGRPPTDQEIAESLGLDEGGYRDLLARIAEAGMARLELMDFDQDEVESGGDPIDDEAGRKELLVAMVDAIEGLPPRLQQVLALYYQEGCTLREVGAVLGISESMASRLQTEAIHRLRAAIGRE
jgi:RNA polymerase sigma factor for flagellar operon FliA